MNATKVFRLPDVGEGLTEAEIVAWHIAVGDEVEVNAILVEIETAKSLVEIPSPYAGYISDLHAGEGETLAVGQPLVTLAESGPDAGADGGREHDVGYVATDDFAPGGVHEAEYGPGDGAEEPLVLVGTAPKRAAERRLHLRPRRMTRAETRHLNATPPVRAYAKRMGVDLDTVVPQGDGELRRRDVDEAIRRREATATSVTDLNREEPPKQTMVPIRGIIKSMGQAMESSAKIPYVTESLAVDVTNMMDLTARLKRDPNWSGTRISPAVFVAKALVVAALNHPRINSVWREDDQMIVEKLYVNLGIAVATSRGLIVPNIKNVHGLKLRELSESMDLLIADARQGKTMSDDMQGGTISLTNIGALGVDSGTPLINPGESAILAFGRVRPQPAVVDGELAVRSVAQLDLTFDHRHVDGAMGARVLSTIGAILENPGESMLYV